MQYSSISRMIIVPVMIAIGILVAANAASIFKTFDVLSDVEAIEQTSLQAERDIKTVLSNFQTQVQEWKNVLLRGKNDDDRKKYWQRFQDREQDIQSELRRLRQLDSLSAGAKSTIDQFLGAHDIMAKKYREGYQAFVESNYNASVGDNFVRGIDREPSKLLKALSKDLGDTAQQQSEALSRETRRTMWLILVAIIVLSVASIFYVISRLRKQVIKPTKAIARCLVALEKNNYQHELKYTSQHELGQLADATRSLQLKLQQAVDVLLESEKEVVYASDKLVNISSKIQRGADEQASASIQLEGNTGKLYDISRSLSAITQQVSVATQQSEVKVADCNTIFTQANRGFRQLAQTVAQSSDIVNSLQNRSTTIHKVVTVINEIADQTNLLALNAAIEAARAGDHGRGFAVVADEVRALAAKTQQSTKEINQILEAFEHEAQSAVDAMGKGKLLSDSNAEQAEKALENLQSLVQDVNETASVVQALNQATEEQNRILSEVEQVTTNVVSLATEYREMSGNTEISDSINKATKHVDRVVLTLSK